MSRKYKNFIVTSTEFAQSAIWFNRWKHARDYIKQLEALGYKIREIQKWSKDGGYTIHIRRDENYDDQEFKN